MKLSAGIHFIPCQLSSDDDVAPQLVDDTEGLFFA